MSKNNISVPEAKAALDQFKMQAASEVGVTLNQNGYNGNLTSKQAGSIGGQMVNGAIPIRTFERALSFFIHFSVLFPVKILISSLAEVGLSTVAIILSIYSATNSVPIIPSLAYFTAASSLVLISVMCF